MKKFYISADIEGITGVAHWDETSPGKSDYNEFRQLMTDEVVTAIKALKEITTCEILVNDAHGNGRNIILGNIDAGVKILRGWSGHPNSMVDKLDETFTALIYIGYHAKAYSSSNPLSHTLNSSKIHKLSINNTIASEFTVHSYLASYYKVPIIFLSGDLEAALEAKAINPSMEVVATKEGIGDAVLTRSPHEVREEIKEKLSAVAGKIDDSMIIPLPEKFNLEIEYTKTQFAYKNSFYPGVSLQNPKTIQFSATDYFEVMRFLAFVTL